MRVRSFIFDRPYTIIKISTRIGQKRQIHELMVECHQAQEILETRYNLSLKHVKICVNLYPYAN